jgi:hypothetical protein
MADDAPTAPGAAGLRHTAASQHDSSSEAFRVGVQPEGTDDGALQPRGHALDDHESLNTRGGCARQSWIPLGCRTWPRRTHVSSALARGVQA